MVQEKNISSQNLKVKYSDSDTNCLFCTVVIILYVDMWCKLYTIHSSFISNSRIVVNCLFPWDIVQSVL